MTRIDLSALHGAWDAYRGYPHAEVVSLNARPEVGRALALDVLIYVPDDRDDESTRTWFATAGLSLLTHLSDVGPFELELAVRGRLTRDERTALARRFADLAIAPLRHELVVRPGLAFGFDLPVFIDRVGVIVVDVGWSTPEHLPWIAPRVRVLEVFTLHARELEQQDEVGAAEARVQFLDAGVDLIDRNRRAVDLDPSEPSPPTPQVRSPLMAKSKHDVKSIWADIDKWLEANAPTTLAALDPGVSAETVASVEETIGHKLPPDVVASYQVHNGYAGLTDYEYISLEVGLEMWESRATKKGKAPKKSAHQGKIKPVFWHPGWFPIAMDSGGNFLCVDLDPADEGTVGQIIFWEKQEGPFASDLDGWGAWLAKFRDGLKAGKFGTDENGRISQRKP